MNYLLIVIQRVNVNCAPPKKKPPQLCLWISHPNVDVAFFMQVTVLILLFNTGNSSDIGTCVLWPGANYSRSSKYVHFFMLGTVLILPLIQASMELCS